MMNSLQVVESYSNGTKELGVRDKSSGTWWPDAATAAEIATAGDPEAEAIRICAEEPMRGTWTNAAHGPTKLPPPPKREGETMTIKLVQIARHLNRAGTYVVPEYWMAVFLDSRRPPEICGDTKDEAAEVVRRVFVGAKII